MSDESSSFESSESSLSSESSSPLVPDANTAPGQPVVIETPAPEPVPSIPSPGSQVYDRSRQILTELFDSADVVFIREGKDGALVPYPSHEAEARFAELDGPIESEFKGARTITDFKLKDGTKITLDGLEVITTPAEGPASVQPVAVSLADHVESK